MNLNVSLVAGVYDNFDLATPAPARRSTRPRRS
jgi:hypothetical protein